VRERDTLARLRGHEFAMLLEGCSVPVGVRIAEDILKGINLLRFELRARRWNSRRASA
jgi:PleD family two-component response regulator